MTDVATMPSEADLAEMPEPATLRLTRLLPGPVERVWSYLIDSDLRRQWLAAGTIEPRAGTDFELVWRNDELTDPPGRRPEGFGAEHRAEMHVLAADPPTSLTFAWPGCGEVSIDLAPQGDEVLLTLTHSRVPDRKIMLNAGAGWHMHLDLLVARMRNAPALPFWDGWAALRDRYESRLMRLPIA